MVCLSSDKIFGEYMVINEYGQFKDGLLIRPTFTVCYVTVTDPGAISRALDQTKIPCPQEHPC